ncbi:MAG TPA: hypothetical protein VHP37_04965 [Burkholderiales bacterium]|jgi:hypothetical protein|nr:hypothetical protein [Burkholderiales bacterium]
MKFAVFSLLPSAIGVAIVMSGSPSQVDFVRAGVCFALAFGMCVAGSHWK